MGGAVDTMQTLRRTPVRANCLLNLDPDKMQWESLCTCTSVPRLNVVTNDKICSKMDKLHFHLMMY